MKKTTHKSELAPLSKKRAKQISKLPGVIKAANLATAKYLLLLGR